MQRWFWGASLAIPAGAALASINAGPDHLILTATESGRQHPANPWQHLLPPPTTPPDLPITADLLFAEFGSSEEKALVQYGDFWGLIMAIPHPDVPVDSLEWVIETTSQAMLVRPAGEVNVATVPLLWSNLKAMREDNLNVIVDLKATLGIDSAGMHALLDAYQLFIQCGQRLVLAEPSPMVRTLLEVAGLEKAMPIFASVAEALASFRSAAVPLPKLKSDTAQAWALTA